MEIVEVEPVKVPELLIIVPVPERVRVYELASRAPEDIVRALETVVVPPNVAVPPVPDLVRLT